MSTFFEPHKAVLYTERMILRFPKTSDTRDLFELCSDPLISKYSLWHAHEDLWDTKGFVRHLRRNKRDTSRVDFCMQLRETGKVIGTCGFTHLKLEQRVGEIGYCVSREYQREGYASEAVEALVKFGFENLDLARIEARVVTENEPSAALLRKLEFTLDGSLKKGITFKAKTFDLLLYSMTDYKGT